MTGREDTVIGDAGNAGAKRYAATHKGSAAYLEIVRGGHVSFTSCEHYTPTYGNGIGPSSSLTRPGETYEPLPIEEQHAVINSYGLAFLNAHLKGDAESKAYLGKNHFDPGEVVWECF